MQYIFPILRQTHLKSCHIYYRGQLWWNTEVLNQLKLLVFKKYRWNIFIDIEIASLILKYLYLFRLALNSFLVFQAVFCLSQCFLRVGPLFPFQNRYFTEIQCCRPLNHPERNEECYVEDVTSFNAVGMSECQREGYFITGFYEKESSPFPRLEKFNCCKMAGNCVLFVTSIPDCRKL